MVYGGTKKKKILKLMCVKINLPLNQIGYKHKKKNLFFLFLLCVSSMAIKKYIVDS